jgi:hypothetical protein
MGKARIQDEIRRFAAFEPVEEGSHLDIDAMRLRRFIVDALLADGAGDDLHRSRAVIAPSACPDLGHAAAAGWEASNIISTTRGN